MAENKNAVEKGTLRMAMASLGISILSLLAAGISTYYAYKSNQDNRLVLQLDRAPRIRVAAHLNQMGKFVAVENHGDASALDLQVQVSIKLYDSATAEITSSSGTTLDEWCTNELPATGELFAAHLDKAKGRLPYLFEPDTLLPGRNILDVRVTFKRAVDSLRYKERALYIFGVEHRWISASQVAADPQLYRKYGRVLRCALNDEGDFSLVPHTDAIESRSWYGAEPEQ